MKQIAGLVLFVLLAAVLVSPANAANRIASVSGNWNSTATWGGQAVPGSGDNVTVNHNITVTIDIVAACNGLTLNENAAGDATIQFNSGQSLTVGGAFTWGQTAARRGVVDMTNGGTFTLNNVVNATSGEYVLNAGTGTIVFSRAGAQTIPAATYNNLTLGGSNAKTMPASAMSITGNFEMSGTATATARGAMSVDGNFTIGAGTTFSAGAFVHQIKGNWSRLGTFNANTSTFSFIGTSNQSISGTSTFSDLEVNNAAGVTLSSSVSINSSLVLTSGNLTTTSTNLLTLGTAAGVSGGSATSFVNGPMAHTVNVATATSREYPIGKGTVYRPLTLGVTQGNTTSRTYTAEVFNSAPAGRTLPPTLDRVSVVRYWNITQAPAAAVTSADVTITYGDDDGVSDASNLRVAKQSGSAWLDQGGTGSGSPSGTITSSSFSSFSDFVLANGSGGGNPLPIQLASLTAVTTGQSRVTVMWSTVSETNNYGFEVQKSTSDAKDGYESIPGSFVPGHGTTLKPQSYSYVDEAARSGVCYYRLKQIDLDGTANYTDGIRVSALMGVDETAPKVFALSQNYPNPFNPETQIRFSVEQTGRTTLHVYNALGQEVATLFDGIAQAGQYYIAKLNGMSLASGLYFYKLESGTKSDLKKMVLLK